MSCVATLLLVLVQQLRRPAEVISRSVFDLVLQQLFSLQGLAIRGQSFGQRLEQFEQLDATLLGIGDRALPLPKANYPVAFMFLSLSFPCFVPFRYCLLQRKVDLILLVHKPIIFVVFDPGSRFAKLRPICIRLSLSGHDCCFDLVDRLLQFLSRLARE